MVYERFSDRARKVMQLANSESQKFNLEFIDAPHILLAICREAMMGGGGMAAKIIQSISCTTHTLVRVCEEVTAMISPGPDRVSMGKLPQTPNAKKVIEYAIEEASNYRQNYIGSEHLLMGLLRGPQRVTTAILAKYGITLDKVKKWYADHLAQISARTPIKEDRVDFSKWTDRSHKVLQLATQEAQRFSHTQVSTPHVLLGLVKEGSGVAANVLKDLGLDLAKIRTEVEKLLVHGLGAVTIGKLPHTETVERAFVFAAEEATALKHTYVGTEHILLGLLRCPECIAEQVLRNLGVTPEKVREETLGLLGQSLSQKAQQEAAKAEDEDPIASELSDKIDEAINTFYEYEFKKELKKEREAILAKAVHFGAHNLASWIRDRIEGREMAQHSWTVTCTIGIPITEEDSRGKESK